MTNRVQQDTFMDDSDETCPLCVEEFDLSDKCFKPCPCGYQICQFCYNNIKNNMNNLCPACRRVYDEKNAEFKTISPEEHKADAERQARRKALAKQKESEKKQVETLSRKHLIGKRVVQKDLVYVSGLNRSNVAEDELMTAMRNDDYFGKYGPIRKVVASKAREGPGGSNSIALYVTFEHADDAQKCIAAVNGSVNAGRTLRAQLGTTKYCSKYLRNEQCNNPNCMFLHEIAEDSDSYTRQELSSLNAGSTQRPGQSSSNIADPPQPQPIPQQVSQVASTASQGMARQGSRDEAMSRSDSGDGSALPSTASWATKNSHVESRRSSKPASIAALSPVVTSTSVASKAAQSDTKPLTQPISQFQARAQSNVQPGMVPSSVMNNSALPSPIPQLQGPSLSDLDLRRPRSLREDHPFHTLMERALKLKGFAFDRGRLSEDLLREIDAMPPLYDANAGMRIYRTQKRQEEERRREEENRKASSRPSSPGNEDEELRTGGSLQLGGEPEVQNDRASRASQAGNDVRGAIQPPFTSNPIRDSPLSSIPTHSTLQGRFQAPQVSQVTRPAHNASLHQHQQSNPFQNSNLGVTPGHTRHMSRFNFANDSNSHTTTVNPTSNAHLFSQQGPTMGSIPSKQPQGQTASQNQHYFSNVQGPPPGFKSSGTPPVSGGGMFGQGHGFGSAMGGNLGLGQAGGNSKNTNEELMREILRGRESVNSSTNHFGKREFTFPSKPQPSTAFFPNAPSLQSPFQRTRLGSLSNYQDQVLQKQKKKGKKHRNADTSSSGGGGLVDLADPSILQARMNHGSVGQGQYGLSQESRVLPQLGRSLPSTQQPIGSSPLVSRNIEPVGAPVIPQGPRGLAKPGSSIAPTANSQSKPKVPIKPAVPQPHDFPPLAAPAEQPLASKEKATPSTVIASNFKPAIPALAKTTTRDVGSRRDIQGAQPTQKIKAAAQMHPGTSESGELEGIVTKKDQAPSSSNDADCSLATKGDSETSTKSKGINVPTNDMKGESLTRKKNLPSILDISATDAADLSNTSASNTSPVRASKSSTIPITTTPTASQPVTPTKALIHSAPSSATRNQARTLRLAETPKTDSPIKPASPATTESVIQSSVISRRSSLVSAQAPGTPVSERISDNISMPSTALSRASSPGLGGKVGSASARQISKNQRKKERQTQAKQIEVESRLKKTEEEVVKEQKVEVMQAPIQGRKKKTKKANTAGTTTSTPVVTRPSSPTFRPTENDVPDMPPTPAFESTKSTTTQAGMLQPSAAAPPSEVRPVTELKPNTSLLNALETADQILPGLFKTIPFSGRHLKFTQDELLTGKLPSLVPGDLSEIQREDHCQGKPVIVQLKANENDSTGHCVVLLPGGGEIWENNLELAEQYVRQYERLRNKNDHLLFTPDPTKLPGRAELERWVPKLKTAATTSAAPANNALGKGKKSTSTRIGVGNVEFTYDEEPSPTSSLEDLPVISHWVADQDSIPFSSIPSAAKSNTVDDFAHKADPNSPTYSSFHRGFSFMVPLNDTNAIAAAPVATVNSDIGISGFRGMKLEELKRELEDLERMVEVSRKEEAVAAKMLGLSIKKNRKMMGI